MKKNLFSLLVLGLLANSSHVALAQTAKPNTPPADTRPQTEQGTGISHVGNSIPAAAYYPGGQDAMYAFIAKEIKYPLLAKRNRMQGQCIVGFVLAADGTLQEVKLVHGVGGGTGEEALRVVRLLQFKKPEYPVKLSIPIVFKLGVTGANALENSAPGSEVVK
ncbi:MAG: energy transducer TonB [Janthinobacterium lividum]